MPTSLTGYDAVPPLGSERTTRFPAAEQVLEEGRAYRALITTNKGDIVVDLHQTEAPATVNNFVVLAREGLYDGVVFHRVIPGFMVQGGDPTGTGTGGPGYRFADELDAAHRRGYRMGTLAMAHAGPDTNGSQFFITHQDVGLPPQYAVFGTAVEGLEVVDAIATTETDRRDRPVENVVIETVAIREDDPDEG